MVTYVEHRSVLDRGQRLQLEFPSFCWASNWDFYQIWSGVEEVLDGLFCHRHFGRSWWLLLDSSCKESSMNLHSLISHSLGLAEHLHPEVIHCFSYYYCSIDLADQEKMSCLIIKSLYCMSYSGNPLGYVPDNLEVFCAQRSSCDD